MAPSACGDPSRLAVENGEHLRMTAVYAALICWTGSTDGFK
jgi:hypothetical protein